MNIAFRIAVLLLVVETISGANTQRAVSFPDLSGENSEEFEYGDIDTSNSKRPKTKIMKFRIDSSDVPCVNTTMFFCEEVTNQAYPKQYVESMLLNADSQTYEQFFNKTLPNETLGLRSSTDEPIELCDSIKRVIYPQLAMSVQREWHFVINQPSYQQPIHVEICQQKQNKCCVQKYLNGPLLSLGEDGKMVSYNYEFPAYCQCEKQRKKHEKLKKRHRY